MQLMKVEKTPDSTYEMIGGVDKQIKDCLLHAFELSLAPVEAQAGGDQGGHRASDQTP